MLSTGFVFTTYSYMRRSNNASNQSAGKYGDYVQTHGGVTSTVRALAMEYSNSAGFVAFDFRTATPLVAMLTALPASFTEVHMGMTKVPGKNRVGNDRGKNITAYGLNNAHIPLLHGVTFPPERRTSLLRGLGPMTLAIMLIEETNYKQKIKDALLQSIKHLPNAASIVEALANGTWKNTALLKNLADVLLITSHRSARRIYFPIFVLRAINAESVKNLNFTGTRGISVYQLMAGTEMLVKCNDPDLASQAIFHAIFGTNVEDLGILSAITERKVWKQRKDFSEFFKRRSEQNSKAVKLPAFLFISKMLTANPTKFAGTIRPMLAPGMIFSGNRKRNFTAAFNEYLVSGNQMSIIGGDAAGIAFSLRELVANLRNEMAKQGGESAGTTGWLKVTNTAEGFAYDESDFVAVERP